MKIILENGTEIIVEDSNHSPDFEAQSVHVDKITIKFSTIADTAANLIKEALTHINNVLEENQADQLELTIGLKISSEGSIILAKGQAEANISIKATWKK